MLQMDEEAYEGVHQVPSDAWVRPRHGPQTSGLMSVASRAEADLPYGVYHPGLFLWASAAEIPRPLRQPQEVELAHFQKLARPILQHPHGDPELPRQLPEL
jgi:hypothetical protein